MPYNICVNIDIVGGTEIKGALEDAKELACVLGDSVKFVCFNFNEKHVCISSGADIKHILKEYKSKKKYIGG